jgi:pyridoxine 5-phosphate synthase
MTRLSVNINKVALLRNSRGGNLPDVVQVAKDCEAFGAQGITVHPRPDERHIRYQDVRDLKPVVTTELNIEGYPDQRFMDLVLDVIPEQCTLVPDPPGALTSSEGWDTIANRSLLTDVVSALRDRGIRVSLFVNADPRMVEGAAITGAHRVELYTGRFAHEFHLDPNAAIASHILAARAASQAAIGLNAGHDLNLENLAFYATRIPVLLEVSIGHALIADALYYGLRSTIGMYRRQLGAQLPEVLDKQEK